MDEAAEQVVALVKGRQDRCPIGDLVAGVAATVAAGTLSEHELAGLAAVDAGLSLRAREPPGSLLVSGPEVEFAAELVERYAAALELIHPSAALSAHTRLSARRRREVRRGDMRAPT